MTAGRRSLPSPRMLMGLSLVGVALAALALAPPAAAADEAEPNDSLLQANTALLNESATGQVQSLNEDFWSLDTVEPGLLTVDINTLGGAAYVAFQDANGDAVPSGFQDGGALHDTYRIVSSAAEPLYLVITTNNPDTAYTLTFSFVADLADVTGPAETEPNNVQADAAEVLEGLWADGEAPIEYADIDWWVYNAPSAGWLWVEVRDIAEMSIAAFSGTQELEDQAASFTYYYLFELQAAGPAHISVMADFGDGSYSLGVRFATNSSIFYEGPDESENNGRAADASEVTPGQTFHGIGDILFDPDDFLVVHAPAGTLIEVNVTFDYDPFVEAWVTVVGAPDAGFWDYEGDTWYFEVTAVFATAGDLTFNVSVGWTDSTYSVNVTHTQLAILSDGVATLDELSADERFGLWFHPANDYGNLGEGVDLTTGGGYMFGESMCAEVDVIGNLPRVGVVAGSRLVPTYDDELQVLVISRSEEVAIPSEGEGCFRAMSESEEGLLGYPEAVYELGTPLDGDAAAVVAQINASHRDNAEGQLALWAVTSGTSAARARTWGATQLTIDQAADILNNAGVVTSISPDAGNTGGNNENGGNGGSTGGGTGGGLDLFPIIVGIVILLVLVGVAGAAVRSRNRAKAQPPAGQAGATQHVSPRLYGAGQYGQAQYGQAQYGQAQYGQAQYGASQAPPAGGYAAPQPPSAPPAQQYGSPYGAASPYGTQQPAPPPRAPQQPAAPQGTAPCPSCGSPVAYYAPQCGQCGHQLNWS